MKTLDDCGIELPEIEPVWDDPHAGSRHAEAMQKVHALVCVRERCEKEVRERLLSCGFTPEEAEKAVAAALSSGLVSDERYANAFVRGKVRKGWGREKILARLRADGISQTAIESCADDFASPARERAHALAELARRSCRAADRRSSLIRRLLAKGYAPELARECVDEFLEDKASAS